MTRLEKLQAKARSKLERLAEIREMEAADVTEEIRTEMKGLMDDLDTLKVDIEAETRAQAHADAFGASADASAGRSVPPENEERSGHRFEIKDQPIYRSMFPFGEQIRDIVLLGLPNTSPEARKECRGRLEQVVNREEQRAAGTGGHVEAIGSDGGWLLQGETSIDLMTKGFNNSEVLKRCAKRTLTNSSKIEIIGIDESSRATGSRGGGVRVYTTAELDAMTQSKTKFNKVTIEPFKLTGLYYASDEILQDAGMLQQEMSGLFTEEFAFKVQDLVIRGGGAGEALGILNAACTVSQAIETGQSSVAPISENIIKMKSRVFQRNRANLIFLINQDVEPYLYFLTIAVGTGGSVMPLYTPPGTNGNPYGMLLGIPVVPIEQCNTTGTVGDIILADFSQYYVADKGAMNSASSIHLKFDYNQTTFRFIYRIDGRPRWESALTPFKGGSTKTVSPFVTLAVRS